MWLFPFDCDLYTLWEHTGCQQTEMILAVSLVVFLFASDASCQTVVTYSSKISEELLCQITDETSTAIWSDETTVTTLANYMKGRQPEIEIGDNGSKYDNFNYTSSFSLLIQPVQADDGGDYACITIGGKSPRYSYTVVVEVIPGKFSLDCFVPPVVTCPEQDVNPPSELICVCAANGVRPGTLYLDIPDAHSPQQNESIVNGNLFDLRLKATVPVTESMSEVTCSVKGYITMEQIPSELITTNLTISPPTTCTLDISFDHKCTEAALTCSCSASPTDGESPDKGMVYSYFNGTGHIIESETTTTVQTNDVAAGVVNTYSCRGCNGLYYGDSSNVTKSSECTINDKFPVWAIILIIVVALGCCGGGGAVIICWCKPGEDDSKPSDDKPDDNGAGPGKDPEIPAYGVIDKNRTKDPTPAPRSSMRDSKNPSKPKQYGPMEMKYADLDHGKKPPSDEVRKPKEEPTEYATVQPVIV